eukprot:m.696919 g.696919  ORF g.696919 m.696919 type:complete len:1378 (+) comp22896_c0_seq10:444-4577(+)
MAKQDHCELGRTLFDAAAIGDIVEVDRLLELNADASYFGWGGDTPLHIAAQHGHNEVMQLLVSRGNAVNVAAKHYGNTPLHTAALKGHVAAVQILLEGNANVNAQDAYRKNTPLHNAALNGHLDIVRLLLENKGDLFISTKGGALPLHKAAHKGHGAVVACLLRHNADSMARDNDGYTGLHRAAAMGQQNVVDVLLATPPSRHTRNADWITQLINARNHQGQTAAQVALEKGFTTVSQRIDQTLREAILLADGAVELQEGKLHLCGFAKVGKTTLVERVLSQDRLARIWGIFTSLWDGRKGEPLRTAGMNVSRLRIDTEEAPWVVVDFAGQMEYYVTHEMFMTPSHGIFIVMCKLTDPWKKQCADVLYWLKFIATKSLGSRGAMQHSPRVLVVGSFADKCSADVLDAVRDGWAEKMNEIQDTFAGVLQIDAEVVLINGKRPNAATSALKHRLQLARTALVHQHVQLVPKLVLEMQEVLWDSSTRAKLGPIISLTDLLPHVQLHIPRCTEETLVLLLGYLHFIGVVLYFSTSKPLRQIVVLDPQWFGTHVLGRVLAPKDDNLRDGDELVDPGTAGVAYATFEKVLTRASSTRRYDAVPRKFVTHVVHILEALQVCTVVHNTTSGDILHCTAETKVGRETPPRWLVFPSLLPPEQRALPAGVWVHPGDLFPELPGATPLGSGRRLRVEDARFVIPSGFFPTMQVKVRSWVTAGHTAGGWNESGGHILQSLRVWHGGMCLTNSNGCEAVLQQRWINPRDYDDDATSGCLDIVVRCLRPKEQELSQCKTFLDALMEMCEQHLGDLRFERHILDLDVMAFDGNIPADTPTHTEESIRGSIQHWYTEGKASELLDLHAPHSSRLLMSLAGHVLVAPMVQMVGRTCVLSTVYQDPRVEIWYSIDGTIPRRGISRSWEGEPWPLPPGVLEIKARAYFCDVAASDVTAVDVEADTAGALMPEPSEGTIEALLQQAQRNNALAHATYKVALNNAHKLDTVDDRVRQLCAPLCALSHELQEVVRTLEGISAPHRTLTLLAADVQQLLHHTSTGIHPGADKHPEVLPALLPRLGAVTQEAQTLQRVLTTPPPGAEQDPGAALPLALAAMEQRLANLILSTQHPDVPWLYVVVPEARPRTWWERANVFHWGTRACRVHLLCNGRPGESPHFLFDAVDDAARTAQLDPHTGAYRGYPLHIVANQKICAIVRYSVAAVRACVVATMAVGAKMALGGLGALCAPSEALGVHWDAAYEDFAINLEHNLKETIEHHHSSRHAKGKHLKAAAVHVTSAATTPHSKGETIESRESSKADDQQIRINPKRETSQPATLPEGTYTPVPEVFATWLQQANREATSAGGKARVDAYFGLRKAYNDTSGRPIWLCPACSGAN